MKPVRVWFGLLLLSIGLLGVADAADLLDAGPTWDDWWPLAIIALGALVMIGHRRVTAGPLIVSAVGLALLADSLDWTDEDVFGPLLLILLGGAVLVGIVRGLGTRHTATSGDSLAVFGGTTVKDRSGHFSHADASAIFGGATLDLREAHIDGAATVDAFAFCGGVDILVPKGWRVTFTGTPVFGAYEDKTTGTGWLPDTAPVLHVNATAICGGVTVANKADDEAAIAGPAPERPAHEEMGPTPQLR